jgi:hypothetical protein
MTIPCMRSACWIPKAINTHSEYVILIDFCTATMIAVRHYNVTLQCITCLVIILCKERKTIILLHIKSTRNFCVVFKTKDFRRVSPVSSLLASKRPTPLDAHICSGISVQLTNDNCLIK